MDKFARSFITEWRRLGLPFENETIIAAISGGGDSVALLLVLNELSKRKKFKNQIIVAHFDHQIRGRESLEDAEFVENLAGKFGFDFVLGKPVTKIDGKKENLEQAARTVRYAFLHETAAQKYAAFIITAHTMSDQAETFLFNLLRGSGLDGLAAMKPLSKVDDNSTALLARPFLSWALREDTENYVTENGQAFRHDAMNDDLNFTRVRLREKLLPLLRNEYNPRIIETLARTAMLIAAEKQSKISPSKVSFANPLPLSELKNLSEDELISVMREWLKRERGNLRRLTYEHFRLAARLARSEKSGRKIELPGGEVITKSGGKLFFKKAKVEKSLADN